MECGGPCRIYSHALTLHAHVAWHPLQWCGSAKQKLKRFPWSGPRSRLLHQCAETSSGHSAVRSKPAAHAHAAGRGGRAARIRSQCRRRGRRSAGHARISRAAAAWAPGGAFRERCPARMSRLRCWWSAPAPVLAAARGEVGSAWSGRKAGNGCAVGGGAFVASAVLSRRTVC